MLCIIVGLSLYAFTTSCLLIFLIVRVNFTRNLTVKAFSAVAENVIPDDEVNYASLGVPSLCSIVSVSGSSDANSSCFDPNLFYSATSFSVPIHSSDIYPNSSSFSSKSNSSDISFCAPFESYC